MKSTKILACLLALLGSQPPVWAQSTTATSASGSASTSGAGANVDSSIDNAASNAGNNQSITYNSSIPDAQSIKTVPSSFAPALTTTLSETCMGSSSAGGSVLGFGLSAGSTWRDHECMRRLNARELANTLGDRQAAREVMCGNEEVFRVYNALGRPCRLMPDGSANPEWKPEQVSAVLPPKAPLEPFTVYFESGKSDLSPGAVGELDRAVAAFNDRRSCCVRVLISGHTDRAGSAKANDELSTQRAEVARAYLTSKGVPPDVQVMVALGEKAPAIPTPDGIPNPLNRRVEILLGPWSGL
ncbi:MAG: OmpA family protein [Chakrabartia sp.]